MPTSISWAHETWNPVTGCSHVSEGCRFCYAERLSRRFRNDFLPWIAPHAAENVRLHPERLRAPLAWKKPKTIFVCSMADLFHEQVPDDYLDQVFAMMFACPQHIFLVLTKRADRMRAYLTDFDRAPDVWDRIGQHYLALFPPDRQPAHMMALRYQSHIWLGTSAERQQEADERIPLLLATPAANHFLSAEPLLNPLDIRPFLPPNRYPNLRDGNALRWVITGGESGGPADRALVRAFRSPLRTDAPPVYIPTPAALDWVRAIRDQCAASGVRYHHKQWGGPRPDSAGNVLDGQVHDWMPSPPQPVSQAVLL